MGTSICTARDHISGHFPEALGTASHKKISSFPFALLLCEGGQWRITERYPEGTCDGFARHGSTQSCQDSRLFMAGYK